MKASAIFSRDVRFVNQADKEDVEVGSSRLIFLTQHSRPALYRVVDSSRENRDIGYLEALVFCRCSGCATDGRGADSVGRAEVIAS